MKPDAPTLSICLTCRDGREEACDSARGGTRLARAVSERVEGAGPCGRRLCGVRCMRQCKRPCIAALSAPGRLAYLFGDLDPQAPDHAAALLALHLLYREAPEGFLRRDERPEALRPAILGRLPPPLPRRRAAGSAGRRDHGRDRRAVLPLSQRPTPARRGATVGATHSLRRRNAR